MDRKNTEPICNFGICKKTCKVPSFTGFLVFPYIGTVTRVGVQILPMLMIFFHSFNYSQYISNPNKITKIVDRNEKKNIRKSDTNV